jgi:16S rRNA (adenine1518-N6/adenine1519-N6)-dimethyltransferase
MGGPDSPAEDEGGRPLRIVGNLPYNISTPLVFHLLGSAAHIADMHFMLQKEVVDRMAAEPGSDDYGRLSVLLQYRCRVEPQFIVPPDAFHPRPKVHSAIVRLVPRAPEIAAQDESLLDAIVTDAFGQRRKTLRNALRQRLDEDGFAAAGIDPGARAETLSLAQFVQLADVAARRAAAAAREPGAAP